jgi:hypothetical protein
VLELSDSLNYWLIDNSRKSRSYLWIFRSRGRQTRWYSSISFIHLFPSASQRRIPLNFKILESFKWKSVCSLKSSISESSSEIGCSCFFFDHFVLCSLLNLVRLQSSIWEASCKFGSDELIALHRVSQLELIKSFILILRLGRLTPKVSLRKHNGTF